MSRASDLASLVASLATLNSPTLTGNPTAPTPTAGDNDTSIATTAFVTTAVASAIASKANLASPTFTGDPKAPTPIAGDNDTSIATTAFVPTAVAAKESTANKGVANGYASLGADGKVPSAQLPATGQPIPTTSSYAVGSLVLATPSSTVTNGSTIAGANLGLAVSAKGRQCTVETVQLMLSRLARHPF